MVHVSFKCSDNGKLITFDFIGNSEADAWTHAKGWVEANGWGCLELVLSRAYVAPGICNVVKSA